MDNEEEDILLGAAALAGLYFIVVKPILGELGLSADQKEAIDSVNNTAPANNPFSPLFQPFIDEFGQYSPIPEQVKALKAMYDSQGWGSQPIDPTNINPDESAKKAEALWSAFSFFTFKENYDLVSQVFATINDQIEVATVSAYLLYNYGMDLWAFIKNGRWYNFSGIPKDEIVQIVNYVKNLPVSKT